MINLFNMFYHCSYFHFHILSEYYYNSSLQFTFKLYYNYHIWFEFHILVDCYYNTEAKSKNYSNLQNNFKHLSRLKNNKFSRFVVSNTHVIWIKCNTEKTLRNGLHRWYYENMGHVCPSENSDLCDIKIEEEQNRFDVMTRF